VAVPASGPVAAPASGPVAAPASGPVALTAPRRPSGPVAIPKAVAIEPLPAEAPRRKRPALSELIESASGAVSAATSAVIPGLDEDVDVGKALARARAITGGDLDRELELLREQSAAPRGEVSIEAASAELARQLGGAPVRKDKSQRWAPPPAVATEPAIATEPSLPAVTVEDARAKVAPVAPEAKAEPVEAKAEPVEAKAELVEAPAEPVEPAPPESPRRDTTADVGAADAEREVAEPEAQPADAGHAAAADAPDEDLDEGVIERDEEDLVHLRAEEVRPRTFAPANVDQILTEPRRELTSGERWDGNHADDAPAYAEPELAEPSEHEVDDAQISDEVHQLADDDYEEEELEHTHIGEPLDPHNFDDPPYGRVAPDPSAFSPQLDAHLADQLDAHLAAAEAEADADADDLDLEDPDDVAATGDRAADHDPDLDLDAAPHAHVIAQDRALSVGGEYDSAIVEELLDAAPTHDPRYATALGGSRGTPLPDVLIATDPGATTVAVPPDDLDEVFDDFEIIAEADAEDADLLLADGDPPTVERERQHGAPQADADFAAQLDLGDDSDFYAPAPEPRGRRGTEARDLSAGQALAALEDTDDVLDLDAGSPSSGVPVSYGGHDSSRSAGVSPPHDFDQSDVIAIPPELRRDHKSRAAARPAQAAARPSQSPASGPVRREPQVLRSATAAARSASAARARAGASDDFDLESALEALDVDLDELAPPPAPTPRPAHPARPQRGAAARPTDSGRVARPTPQTPSGRNRRPATDDGVIIDFDDDDD
jgi:hypothetical protein